MDDKKPEKKGYTYNQEKYRKNRVSKSKEEPKVEEEIIQQQLPLEDLPTEKIPVEINEQSEEKSSDGGEMEKPPVKKPRKRTPKPKPQVEEVIEEPEDIEESIVPEETILEEIVPEETILEEIVPEETIEEKPIEEEEPAEFFYPLNDNKTVISETITIEKEDKREIRRKQKEILKEEKKLEKRRRKKRKSQTRKTIVRYAPDIQKGLSQEIVDARINEGLVNEKSHGSTKSVKQIFFSNIFTFFNLLTLSIAAWLITIGAWKDLIFMIIVLSNLTLGIFQEIKAKKNIDRLSLLSAPTATVIRNGSEMEIGVSEVVLDDLLILDTGRQICTDSIVLDGSIEVNESLLTGESDAIVKKPGDVLYAGSFVVSGKAKARVNKIGKDNYIETLTSQAKKYVKPKSDLLKSLNIIILVMSFVIIPIGGLLFYMQFYKNGIDYALSVRKTAGAMVGMIPSGLYLVTSMALFVGVQRLSSNQVLVQELYCIEMLARVNVLCLDKTGTITDGTMSVQNVIEYNSVAGLSVKNIVSGMLNALGDKNLTSVALEEKFGLGKRIKHSGLIPFSSQRKFNAVTFDRYGTFILGAPEVVMKSKFSSIEADVTKHALEGYRVLLLAHTQAQIINGIVDMENLETVALILIEDNVRPDAIDTINYFKRSKVEVKVISGDNPLTVSKVSERAGIRNAGKYVSLDGLTDAEVIRIADKYTVFGRVSPDQKKILVKALKESGKIVAMTGDGVNDILALKEADCSIAVASGSEAARNVSHLVLMNSNFNSMPKVVSEGRRVINNVAKVACLYLTKTIFSFLLAIQAINSNGAYPISTSQLFMIDLLCIGLPSFVLVLEPNNSQVEGKFLFKIIRSALPGAFTILIISMIVFALKVSLYMNFQIFSTIIVVTATFTCMMVLFEVCRPFNFLRKCLCGFVFTVSVFVTLFMPKFFEFSPILKVGDYYDPTATIETYREVPSVGISKEGYLVIDGYLTNYYTTTDSFTIENENGYLVVNKVLTSYKLNVPQLLSISSDNFYVFDGIMTDYIVDDKVSVYIAPNGTVYLCTDEEKASNKTNAADYIIKGYKTNLNIMPTIVPSSDGYYIINGVKTGILGREILSKEFSGGSNILKVNDEVIDYELEVPILSTLNGRYVVGGIHSNIISMGENPVVTIDNGCYIVINGFVSDMSVRPSISVSKEGFWVVNGLYTVYEVTGSSNNLVLSHDENENLRINGQLTHFEVIVETTIGGSVPRIPLSSMLLMLLLCAVSLPLMRVLRQIIPWFRKQIKNIAVLLTKF